MRILIIEDEELNYIWLKELLLKNGIELEDIEYAPNLKESMKLMLTADFDLIFLDVQLGSENGFELFDLIKPPFPPIIFTTAHKEYAIKAIKKGAIDYLLKPIQETELVAALKKVQSQENLKEDRLVIKSLSETEFIEKENILYVKADRAYSIIVTHDKSLHVSQSLKHIWKKLPSFYRCHRSYIVNPVHIIKLISANGNSIVMRNEDQIPLSDSYSKPLKKQLGV